MSRANEEIAEDFSAVSGALEFVFYGEYETAYNYLSSNLRKTGFLNAGLVLEVMSKIALRLAEEQDEKVRKEIQKKLNK